MPRSKGVERCGKTVETASPHVSGQACRKHFRKDFFLLLGLFRKNEEESIAIECLGYPLAKHEDSRTIRLRLDTFPK